MTFRLIPYEISRTQAWALVVKGNPDDVTQEQSLVYDINSTLVAGVDLPYLSTEVDDIVYAQYQDVLVMTHKNHPPRAFRWDFDQDYAFTEVLNFAPSPTFIENPLNFLYITGAEIMGNSVLTITMNGPTPDNEVFTAQDIGRGFYFATSPELLYDRWEEGKVYSLNDIVWAPSDTRAGQINAYRARDAGGTSGTLEPGHDWGRQNDATDGSGVTWTFIHSQEAYGTIIAYNSATEVQIEVDGVTTLLWPINITADTPTTGAQNTYRWALGSFGARPGFPAACAFHQGRLVFGGTESEPQTIWASAVERFDDFRKGTLDTDPWSFTPTGPSRNAIQNMTSTRRLIVGTQNGFFVVRGSGEGLFITPTNVAIDRDNYGNSSIQNIANVNNRLMYIEDSKNSVRELRYDFDSEGYISTDRSVINQERLSMGVKQLTHVDEPVSSIWMVRTDGTLLAYTYDPTLEVSAWHRHEIQDATVQTICKLPNPSGDRDVLFMIVEYNGIPELHTLDLGGDVFMDRYVAAEFVADVSEPLDFPVGTMVSVIQNGKYFGDYEVQPDSTITVVGVADGDAFVGLKFESDWLSLPYGLSTQSGSPGGKSRRVHNAVLRVLDTADGIQIGTEDKLRPVQFRPALDNTQTPTPLFTGDARPTELGQSYDEQGVVRISTDVPLSAEVLALYPQMFTNDSR